MLSLLARAFGVPLDQIAGPPWLRDVASANNYTIVATIPPGTTKEQFQKMLQNLLVERFHLIFHREPRDFPGYELVVDNGGPKLKEVMQTEGSKPDASADWLIIFGGPSGEDDFPKLPPGPRTVSHVSGGGLTRMKYQERTMAEFVSNLGFLIGSSQGKSVLDGLPQPRVVDKTRLTGRYTFVLTYYDAGGANLGRTFHPQVESDPGNTPAPIASDPSGGPSIFVAVQKQLGLRLNKVAAVPLDMIVVDSVDKVPTAN